MSSVSPRTFIRVLFLQIGHSNQIFSIFCPLIYCFCEKFKKHRVCERLIENWKYFRISRLIEGAQQAIEVHPTTEGVAKLQNLIDARRSINVLEFGYFHKKLANKLSKLYENISL